MGFLTLKGWLTQRPKWLQVAAKRLINVEDLNAAAISNLTVLCKQEANDEFPDIDCSIPDGAFDTHGYEEIRLCSIREVAGVNKLAPRNPLNFGNSNIAVVYGHNGSGKSGYVRLLKHICGARDCVRGQLYKNVFSSKDIDQKAKVSFSKGGAREFVTTLLLLIFSILRLAGCLWGVKVKSATNLRSCLFSVD